MSLFDFVLRLRGVDRRVVGRIGEDHALVEYTFEIDGEQTQLQGDSEEPPRAAPGVTGHVKPLEINPQDKK